MTYIVFFFKCFFSGKKCLVEYFSELVFFVEGPLKCWSKTSWILWLKSQVFVCWGMSILTKSAFKSDMIHEKLEYLPIYIYHESMVNA